MQLFENNAWGTLAATITDAATSLTLTAGQGARFPTPTGDDYFLLTLIALDGGGAESAWEIIKVTARSTDTLTIVRAQDGTTAVGWNAGTRCEMRVTQGTLDNFAQGPSSLTPVANKIPLADANALVDGDWIGVLADKLTTTKDAFNELTAVQEYLIQNMEGLAGYWPASPEYLFEDSAGTIAATLNGVVGCRRRLGDAPVYTAVTVANGTFAADSDWTKGTGWTIANGVATKAAGTASVLSQAVSLTPGNTYLVTYTITRTAGTLTPQFTGGTTVSGTGRVLSGNYESILIAVTGNTTLAFSASADFAGTLDTVTLSSVSNRPALQTTTANKPYLRKTPTSGVYWLDSNTATSALTATLGNLGAACTVARAGAEGVTFTEGVTISSTYNIAPAYGFNSDVAIFDRALTTTEKALLTRYMARGVPLLGSNLVTNGTFDTDTTGWIAGNATLSVESGKLRITNIGAVYGLASQSVATTSGKAFVLGGDPYNGTNGGASVKVANYSGGTAYVSVTVPGTKKIFLATANTIYPQCVSSNTSNGYADYDNISLKEIL